MATIAASPGLSRLLAASVIARVPPAMLSVRLLIQAHHLTGSFAQAGAVTGAYAIALGVGGAPLGRLVDRFGQTVVLLATSVAGAVLLFAIAALPVHVPLAILVTLAGGVGLGTPPVDACLRALLPSLASDPESLPRLYSLEATLVELTYIAGPPLAIGLGVLWSSSATLDVAALVLLVATVAFAVQPASRTSAARRERRTPRGGALRSPALRTLVMIMFAIGVLLGADEVAVIDAAQSLHRAAADVPLFAVWGAGSFVGGLIVTRFGRGSRTTGALVLMVAGLAVGHLALIPVTGSLIGLGLVLFFAGATIAPTESSVSLMVDRFSPKETLTEAFAWLTTAAACGSAVGAAVAGVVADGAGPTATFAFGGGAGALAVLAVGLRSRTFTCAPNGAPVCTSRAISR